MEQREYLLLIFQNRRQTLLVLFDDILIFLNRLLVGDYRFLIFENMLLILKYLLLVGEDILVGHPRSLTAGGEGGQ